jgi:hypothetical protein
VLVVLVSHGNPWIPLSVRQHRIQLWRTNIRLGSETERGEWIPVMIHIKKKPVLSPMRLGYSVHHHRENGRQVVGQGGYPRDFPKEDCRDKTAK